MHYILDYENTKNCIILKIKLVSFEYPLNYKNYWIIFYWIILSIFLPLVLFKYKTFGFSKFIYEPQHYIYGSNLLQPQCMNSNIPYLSIKLLTEPFLK